jgi:hypothetical protein
MKKILTRILLALLIISVGLVAVISYGVYQFTAPVESVPIATPWTDKVDAEAPLPGYPRPQLRRPRWQNLNGRWQYAITPREAPLPAEFDGNIVVPFAIESLLSGVQRELLPQQRLWYSRAFSAPELEAGERLLLHFGAVDWEAEVWLNGVRLGVHQGGYNPFYFDITEALEVGGEQELVVGVWDPTKTGPGSFGKQDLVPHGIYYTAVSGIWQTVWLEPVSAQRIDTVVAVATDLASGSVTLRVNALNAQQHDEVEVTVRSEGVVVASARSKLLADSANLRVSPADLRAWSPDDPFLYDVDVTLWRGSERVDVVQSYFGAREVGMELDGQGIWRLFLNGSPIFHLGLLDQGWWPDGLYTAPTDDALAFDIAASKRMGFNTIRKHVKVEPARWYWHADRLGVLVWQDMPTGGHGGRGRHLELFDQAVDLFSAQAGDEQNHGRPRSPASAGHFRRELAAMIDYLEPFPSVVAWVPFNEAWGQFDTDAILAEVAERDSTRIVDGPSGWIDTGTGDVLDLHVYGREAEFVEALPAKRALVYGEFGGLGYAVEGHLAVESGWGYADFESSSAFAVAYEELLSVIGQLVPRGLAGAIYTQTTDVESEINGLMTYDRRQFKIAPERLAQLNKAVIEAGSAGE